MAYIVTSPFYKKTFVPTAHAVLLWLTDQNDGPYGWWIVLPIYASLVSFLGWFMYRTGRDDPIWKCRSPRSPVQPTSINPPTNP